MPTKRKSDVNQKWNNKKYLINHLIELVVVVIGISIAFALNRWYENTKSEELEQKYMASLFDDLEKDNLALESLIVDSESRINEYQRLLFLLEQDQFQSDSIFIIFTKMMSFLPFDPSLTTYESLKSSGDITIISDFELRAKIIRYYQDVAQKEYHDQVFNSFLDDYILPFTFRNVSFSDQTFIDWKKLRDHEFKNLIIGNLALINQNKDFYYKIRTANIELIDSLKKTITK